MKTLQSICVIILLILISGCTGQAQTTAEILKNGQQREEIMAAISNDHEMMDEMLDYMMDSDHAMQMMEGDQGMMGRMMEKDTAMAAGMINNMMAMMEKDSTMCNMMGGMMMRNKHMMDMMQNMGKSGTMMKGGMMHQNQHKEQ